MGRCLLAACLLLAAGAARSEVGETTHAASTPRSSDTVIQRLTELKTPRVAVVTRPLRTPPLAALSRVFDPNSWSDPAVDIPGFKLLSPPCRSSLRLFTSALTNRTLWAARMSDASGRYSSELLFGNQFWLGSKLLCRVMQRGAPLTTSFHVASINLTISQTLHPAGWTQVWMGMCLPSSCGSEDLRTMLEAGGEAAAAASSPHDLSLSVVKIRPVPGPYSLWADPKLHFTMIVVVIVLVLMVVGSTVEIVSKWKRQRAYQKTSTNNNETAAVKLAALEALAFQKLEPHSQAPQTYREGGPVRRLVLCFSVLSNGRKIMDCGSSSADESLSCIHGLRFYSLAWVIMAHTYLQIFFVAGNKGRKLVAERNFMFQTVTNATFSVDTFFFISGLLVTYVYLRSVKRSSCGVPRQRRPLLADLRTMATRFFSLLGYRFFRLTPAYLFVLVCAELSMKWLKNDSVFVPLSDDDVTCENYWWRNLLYINSLFPRSQMCMLWSWYLSNDTQFYVLSIIILLLSSRYFRSSAACLVLLLVSSCVTCAFIALKYGYLVRIEDRFMLFDELYDKPWTRLSPYIIGMFTGWFLHNSGTKLSISTSGVMWGWGLSLGVMAGLVYGVRDAELGPGGSAAYVALGHAAWGAALSWLVIACSTGHGGPVSWFLSCPLLHPLGRLTYCAYLIHPVIMRLTSFQMDSALHLSSLLSVILFFGNIVAAFLLSLVISLMFEAPFVRILKLILPSPPSTRSQNHA